MQLQTFGAFVCTYTPYRDSTNVYRPRVQTAWHAMSVETFSMMFDNVPSQIRPVMVDGAPARIDSKLLFDVVPKHAGFPKIFLITVRSTRCLEKWRGLLIHKGNAVLE